VHGAWHGGWCWEIVAGILRRRGHTVLTPTQTGLGERAYLMSTSITLDTFIEDVVGVIRDETLDDVILVGHSFGASSVSGAADRVPERIRRLIYLDGALLENGQSTFSKLPPSAVAARIKLAQETSGGLSIPPPPASAFFVTNPDQVAWLTARLTPHPISTLASPLNLANKIGNGLPATFISCNMPLLPSLQPSRAMAKALGMKMAEIRSGHDAMVTAAGKLADLLEAEAG